MQIQPYLFFDGRCEEALAFYRQALGAEVTMMLRFGEAPEGPPAPPETAQKIMHASFTVQGAVVNCSDGHCAGKPDFQGFGLAVTVPEVATAERFFGALGEGGEIRMPLTRTFFSQSFGMVADRFGVLWMVMVGP